MFRQQLVQARHTSQKRNRCRIHIDPHRIHAIFHRRIKRARQEMLIDIVLILTDTDCFRLDLHQFGQRILQAASDRHRTPQTHIQFGKLRRRKSRSRIDRGPGFTDDNLGQLLLRLLRRNQLHQFRGQLIGLPAGGAVADRDELHAMLDHQSPQGCQRLLPLIARLVRIDRSRFQQFACGIDDRHLATGTESRIETQHGLRTGGRRQQ